MLLCLTCSGCRTAHASFVLDALEQAIHERRPVHRGGLVRHSDRGSQYLSIRYSERPGSNHRSAASATAMTTPWPRRSTDSTKPRFHPPARTMAVVRSRRIRHARMGRLVQQQAVARADRKHPARRSRKTILRHAGRHTHRSITQAKWHPAISGRFIVLLVGFRTFTLTTVMALAVSRRPKRNRRRGDRE